MQVFTGFLTFFTKKDVFARKTSGLRQSPAPAPERLYSGN
jgi:hypothetical protein